MTSSRPPRRRRAAILAVVVVGLLLVVGGVLVIGGNDDADGDGLAGVRELPAVATVERTSSDVDLRMRPEADAVAIDAALRRLPEGISGGTVRRGRGVLLLQGGDVAVDPDLLRAFVAMAGARSPGGTLSVHDGSSDDRVEVTVPDRAQAVPLAQELLARLAPDGGRIRGIDIVRIREADEPGVYDLPVSLRQLDLASDVRVARAALAAAAAADGRTPVVSGSARTVELRLGAAGPTDAGVAWRAARRALRLDRERLGDVRIYADALRREDGELRRRPFLSGPADGSPERAVAVLRSLPAGARDAFVATDLAYAQVTVRGPSVARTVATGARSAGVDRLEVRWRAAPADQSWFSGVGAADLGETRIDDAPGEVLRLLPGVARARAAGIPALRWDRQAFDGVPRLKVARPTWLDDDEATDRRPVPLRRLFRAIRSIGWRGPAGLDVVVGPGSCGARPRSRAVARIVATADGRARSVRVGASCTDDEALTAARSAWNATAG